MENNRQPFELRGRLALWKFSPENQKYIGWNLTADEEGCLYLVELLEEMQSAPSSSGKVIATKPATARLVKAISGSRPYKTVRRISLQYHKGAPQLWITEEREDELMISFGEREIELLQTALFRIRKGEADFAIGDANDGHLLYFWWFAEDTK
jgi:hypothetical protein